MNRARVLLADDHRMVAEALRRLLEPKFELVGIVEDGLALLKAAAKLRPDVIVADIGMPKLNGIEALTRLRQDDPQIKVVILTMLREIAYARRALDAGARGFVLKHAPPEELVLAIEAALAGRTFITPALAGDVLDSVRRDPDLAEDPVASLTPRQREVLQLLAEGMTAKETAAALGISARTVEFHKYAIMESTGIDSSAELVHFAIKHGIVDI